MDPKLIDFMPFSYSRNRSAIIISYIDRPPDDENGQKRRDLNRMVMGCFVWTTVLSLGVSFAAGIAAVIVAKYLLSDVTSIAPSGYFGLENGIALGFVGWLWKAPQYFGGSLSALINQIEWYAAKDGYYDQD